MLIQLHGAGFHNRGAQLMLWTAIDRIGAHLPDARFCVEPVNSDFAERASYGLYTLAPRTAMASPRKYALSLRFGAALGRLIPRGEANRYGLARRGDVDAIVDISGYAFGDKWPAQKSRRFAGLVAAAKKRGAPTVMLPQMFGPFDKPDVAAAFAPVVEQATLLYARDDASLACLKQINASGRELRQAPDITIFTTPVEPAEPIAEPYACLVPNVQMHKMDHATWGADYLDRMVACGERVRSLGIAPKVLIHDGAGEDVGLGRELLERLGLGDESLLMEADPRAIKGRIAGARLLIGSRFHAIVAALSVGTPAISLGWAHKYEMLMNDFGVAEYAHAHADGEAALLGLVDRLADQATGDAVAAQLAERKAAMKPTNDAMWDEVLAALS